MTWGVEGLTVRFGDRPALAEVSLEVPPGRVTGVVGGDGAGKTTLLRCLAGVIAPESGEVRRPEARRVGYLSSTSGTYPDLSVDENLAFAARAYGVPVAEARAVATHLLERTELAEARDRLAGHLSGGMRQKLGVIRAMLHRPELLVLDEPTTGIDPVSRADLWWLIARAAADGAAVVLATAYLDEAERASWVLALDDGRTLAVGTPEEIAAAVPGTVCAVPERPEGEASRRAWRRGGGWRVWSPDVTSGADVARTAATGSGGTLDVAPVRPDLHDAVTVAALTRELGLSAGSSPAGGSPPAVGSPKAAGLEAVSTETTGSGASPAEDAQSGAAPGRGRVGPLAQVVAVTRRFGRFVAVDRADLHVESGEVVGLLGANGAGKTTLIRMVLGLLLTTEGSVRLFGSPPSRDTRRRIGYLPQGLGLYDDLTPDENLAFAHDAFGGEPGVLPQSLRPLAGIPVGRLPLGVQRRVAFAQALAHRPDLLVLDEPTSGVDPLARARLWETIREAADGGAGVLVTTHHMDEAEECDRLVVMAEGRVVAEGTLAGILGGARAVVVETDEWQRAFEALEAAELPVALVGRTLRVPGASKAEVARALGGVPTRLSEAAATLEERFLELVLGSARESDVPGGGRAPDDHVRDDGPQGRRS